MEAFIYRILDGGFGVVTANNPKEAKEKVLRSYNKHSGGDCYYLDGDVKISRPYRFSDSPDVMEIGWNYTKN